ncbi:NAD-P-binding protein [Marasmius fiardii PR-910]|nr:NAD-P-binding protein [Marasmius fiardii PR-910]
MEQPSRQLVWFITGTSSGFGNRLVLSALSRGDLVIATARDFEKLQDLYGREERENLRLLQLDITAGFDVIKAIVDVASTIWGRIDVLVNNAGNGYLSFVEEATSDLFRRQFDTNVFGVMDVTNAVLPHMRERKEGTVVVVGSRSVWRADTLSGIGPYAASKAAIHAVADALSVELAPFNIKVLLVAPGAFRTEKIYSIPFNESNPIPDYDDMRKSVMSQVAKIPGNEPGDPVKAMEVIIDVVRGEGVAKGKKWPGTILLGEDAEATFQRKQSTLNQTIQDWIQVIKSVMF